MKLLSIDVGIKNLAYCLFDYNTVTHTHDIILWDVINLCGKPPNCSTDSCKKLAKFMVHDTSDNDIYFCPSHAKKSNYIIPTVKISLQKIKKMKLAELHQVAKDYIIPLVTTTTIKKEELLKTILDFMGKKILQSVSTAGANEFDLIKLGIAMRDAFQKEFIYHLFTIDQIIIENQISPIANRMKTLQGMIAQYFIMHNKTNISFISAANKLKGVAPLLEENIKEEVSKDVTSGDEETGVAAPPGYAARKKEGIKIMLQLLQQPQYVQWLPHFNQHKKKDDLADAFLQGNWYLKKLNLKK
jgi:hypothetical protein